MGEIGKIGFVAALGEMGSSENWLHTSSSRTNHGTTLPRVVAESNTRASSLRTSPQLVGGR